MSYSLMINAEPSRSLADLQDQVPRKLGPIIIRQMPKTRRADLWSMVIDNVYSNLVPLEDDSDRSPAKT